jgi:glycosyltransferase involved in cell wall biosynthesis
MDLEGLFIVWGAFQGSRRSEQIAKIFNFDIEYVYFTTRQGLLYAPFKYAYQAIAMLMLLARRRPDIVFIQNPPTFAPLFVYLYSLMFGAQFIIDTHTGALIYPQWQWTLPLQRFLSRRALTTILTNDYLARQVKGWGANAFVLEDPPMVIEISKSMSLEGDTFKVVMISVAYPDEPVAEVVKVARNLPDIDFYITGDFSISNHFQNVVANAPTNVHFIGFLKEDYFALLEAVDVVVCLTTDDHTFQSGANEALWLGKPLITSNWPVLREYFNQGTIHVENTVEAIQQGLLEMQKNLLDFQAGMLALQEERRHQWNKKAEALLLLIQQNRSSTAKVSTLLIIGRIAFVFFLALMVIYKQFIRRCKTDRDKN